MKGRFPYSDIRPSFSQISFVALMSETSSYLLLQSSVHARLYDSQVISGSFIMGKMSPLTIYAKGFDLLLCGDSQLNTNLPNSILLEDMLEF